MKIFVTGYMASGKTTFGKALAEKLNVPFIDLDQYIESKAEATIAEIFEDRGESGFREIERDMLREAVAEAENMVLACGGGTPCFHDNMEFLNSNGITVFLETSTPVLIARLQEQNATRPLVAGKSNDEIEEKVLYQLRERLPFYMESKLKWSGDDLNSEAEINSNTQTFLSSYPSIFR